jgi:sigma-B regulation protein RsbU (phosphoserine phosphatase)
MSQVHFYHFYKPPMSVSGDFFDVLEISDTVAGVFICDVMGHGDRAALVATIVRGLLQEFADFWPYSEKLIDQLNQRLCRSSYHEDTPIFVSAFYAVADLGKGELRYTNAGHPSPLRVPDPQRSRVPHKLDGFRPGPAMGLFEDAEYEEHRCDLTVRDVLLLFTDGLFEVEGPGGRSSDYPDLLNAVSRRRNLSTSEMCRAVIDEFQHFSINRDFTDDVCLVAMEVDQLAKQPSTSRGHQVADGQKRSVIDRRS